MAEPDRKKALIIRTGCMSCRYSLPDLNTDEPLLTPITEHLAYHVTQSTRTASYTNPPTGPPTGHRVSKAVMVNS